MVGTIGFAGGKARQQKKVLRFVRRIATPYALASAVGGALLGVTAAVAGGLLLPRTRELGEAWILASVFVVAGAADAMNVPIKRLSHRRQVPLSWKHVFPPPMSAALYGFTLGAGVLTAIYSWSFPAFLIAVAVSSNIAIGLMAGVAFSIGRAAPSLIALAARDEWVVDRLSSRVEAFLSRNARFPRLVGASTMWAAGFLIYFGQH